MRTAGKPGSKRPTPRRANPGAGAETAPPSRNDGFTDKQQRILDAASEEFFEKGYTGARLDRVAARLGVTKPFIYYHFKNKADLLAAVCGRTTAFAAVLAEHVAGRQQAPALSLASLVFDLTVRTIAERKYLTVYFRDGRYLPPAVQASLLAERQRFHLALSDLLREGVRKGEFRIADVAVAGQTLTGMMMWVFNWYNPQGKATPQQIGKMMVNLALNAVGAEPIKRPGGGARNPSPA